MAATFQKGKAVRHPSAPKEESVEPPATDGAPAPTAAPSASDPDRCALTLRDGREVVLARPKVATQFMVYRILGEAFPGGSPPRGLIATIKSLMYVSSVAGRAQVRPTDYVQAQALMNDLGDDGTERVANAWTIHFILGDNSLPLSVR